MFFIVNSNNKMTLNSFSIWIFIEIIIMLISANKTQRETWKIEFNNTCEKKIYFTSSSQQYVKFDINITQQLIDFAMCVWYKPIVVLEQNVLFTYHGRNQQLILWKIKKKGRQSTIVLKIKDVLVMEKKIENLTKGQWYHICQYWKGSTGLWALFLDSYILSYGYKTQEVKSNWVINTENGIASINHMKTKKTLHGEIYGFYLMSLNSEIDHRTNLSNKFEQITLKRYKRQFQSSTSTQPPSVSPPSSSPNAPSEPRPAFPRIRKFFKMIRRLIQIVTLPVIRFAQSLVRPWTQRPRPRPSTPGATPSSTLDSDVTQAPTKPIFQTNIEVSTKNPETSKLENSSQSMNFNDLSLLEEQIMIYESKLETEERRHLRSIRNSSESILHHVSDNFTHDSSETAIDSSESIEYTSLSSGKDKCLLLEKNFTNLKIMQASNFMIEKNENSVFDAITHLGDYSQFIQILYNCCNALNDNILISWSRTKKIFNNVEIENVIGCGSF